MAYRSPSNTAPRHRRWLRFGLRAFFVVVAVAGFAFAWKANEVRRQRAAVTWVIAQGGHVIYEHEWDSENLKYGGEADPPGPDWLRSLGGLDYVSRPVHVSFNTADPLDEFPPVEAAILGGWNPGTAQVVDLAPLAYLKNLESLTLSDSQVHDLTPLAGLKNLQLLALPGTQVADLQPLASLLRLRVLILAGTQVTDVSPLAGLNDLGMLDLSGTELADVSPLAGLAQLSILCLRDTQVADIAPLASLPSLEFLVLGDSPVSDLSIVELRRELPSLYVERSPSR